MAKKSTRYICVSCGQVYSSWVGRCSNCQEWNSLEEDLSPEQLSNSPISGNPLKPQAILKAPQKDTQRLKTNINDVDMVLGGGIVKASVNLLAGQPGIGKSTLLLQIANAVANNHAKVLYVSAEESAHQVAMRSDRLKLKSSSLDLATSLVADDIAATIIANNYDLVVVDSIQAISLKQLNSAIGSISQIIATSQLLTKVAKQTATALIIVGHVTKEGNIAGPKVLEHAVDVVIELTGDRYGGFKILRAVKNRFGSTSEVGIFEMSASGLSQVTNPSKALLAERKDSEGSIVLATMEGSRPLLVEVQALVNKTSYGYPKRTASGFSLNRLNLLIAMLEKRTKLKLDNKDVFINIAGGIDINDPAADLAIVMAIGSADRGLKLNINAAVFGELGLSGEIRRAPFMEKRVNEASKLGFDTVIGPSYNKPIKGLNQTSDIRLALNNYLTKT